MSELTDLKEQFYSCMPLFIALGDEVRLGIVAALSNAFSNGRQGLNVNEITQKNESFPPCSLPSSENIKRCWFYRLPTGGNV